MGGDDRTLVVVGPRMAVTVLHSVEVEETDGEVALVVRTGFPREIARWMVEASEQPLLILPRYQWRTEVHLERPLGSRTVVDRGPDVSGGSGADPSASALVRLEAELSGATRPSVRRRLRKEIMAIRRNPWRASGPLS